jgi:hypothetical protein
MIMYRLGQRLQLDISISNTHPQTEFAHAAYPRAW